MAVNQGSLGSQELDFSSDSQCSVCFDSYKMHTVRSKGLVIGLLLTAAHEFLGLWEDACHSKYAFW